MVSKFPKPEEKLIQEAQTICQLPPVNPATSAAGERSFSSARHLKTWLLFTMGDIAVLNGQRRTDSVSITTQEFVFRNKNRKRSFGTLLAALDSITRMDVFVIFVEVVNKMARICNVNGETPT